MSTFLYNSTGQLIVITDLTHESAYPSACWQCGVIRTWEGITDGEDDYNVLVFNHTLYLDQNNHPEAGPAATSHVVCKACVIGTMESFPGSAGGAANLRRIFAGI